MGPVSCGAGCWCQQAACTSQQQGYVRLKAAQCSCPLPSCRPDALLFCASLIPCVFAVPAQWYMGDAAKKELAAATRVKGSDEPPHASSYDAVEEPPEVWQHDYGEQRFDAGLQLSTAGIV